MCVKIKDLVDWKSLHPGYNHPRREQQQCPESIQKSNQTLVYNSKSSEQTVDSDAEYLELLWKHPALEYFFTFWHFSALGSFFFPDILWFLLEYYWLTGQLNNISECSMQSLELCCTGGRVERLLGSSLNAKGKSSFHWLILNVTSLCIIADLREAIFLQQAVLEGPRCSCTYCAGSLVWKQF